MVMGAGPVLGQFHVIKSIANTHASLYIFVLQKYSSNQQSIGLQYIAKNNIIRMDVRYETAMCCILIIRLVIYIAEYLTNKI